MHPRAQDIRGLYAIADTAVIAEADFYSSVEAVLMGGCRIIQYRDKSKDQDKRLAQSRRLAEICSKYDALYIVNDDLDLALASHAHGIHCGKNDLPVEEVRRRNSGLLVGASCYNSLDRAADMIEAGADYIAFGSFFPSSTKPEATPVDVEILLAAKKRFARPVVAIGGIMASNAPGLISCGADAVAVISGVFSSPDPYHASKELSSLFAMD